MDQSDRGLGAWGRDIRCQAGSGGFDRFDTHGTREILMPSQIRMITPINLIKVI
jgi:hypothetical protein